MVANKQHLLDLEEEAARIAAEEAAAASAMGLEASNAATSEFDNNINLVQSQQNRILNQSEPWMATDFLPEDSWLLSANTSPVTEPVLYQKTRELESPYDAAISVFDKMTDANGYPLAGFTADDIIKAKDKAKAEVLARPETQPSIYPKELSSLISPAYVRNPELYRQIYGDTAANQQEEYYNLTDAGKSQSTFDDLVEAASTNEALIAEQKAMDQKAELFKDIPGFSLYQRNRAAFIKQYGQEAAANIDKALGKEDTILAKMEDKAEEKGYFDESGLDRHPMDFKATAANTSSAEAMINESIAKAQANFDTAVDTATTEFIESPTDVHSDDDDTSTANETAKEIVKSIPGSGVNPNEVTKQLSELPSLKTQEDKENWLSNIRSFYSENPEIAHAMVRAAAAFLRTGKWYEAAAAGLEGGIEGAAVKYTKDQHLLAAQKAEKSRQESLRNIYTGASVNKYLKTGNVEDLVIDFTKTENDYAIYLRKKALENKYKTEGDYLKWYQELNPKNVEWAQQQTDWFVNNAKGMYTKMGPDGKEFGEKQSAGIEHGDVMTMILDHAHQKDRNGEYLLPRGPNGEFDLKQIPFDVITSMQNIVENFSRQQYRNYQKNGKKLDTNFNFGNYYNEYRLHTSLVNDDVDDNFDAVMFRSYTHDPEDGEFAGEAMINGTENIIDQIANHKFDKVVDGQVTKPEKEQVWKQLAIQWKALSDDDKQYWNDAALAIDDIATTGFLFFSNKLITEGEDHEWMASRNIKLFHDPNRKNK